MNKDQTLLTDLEKQHEIKLKELAALEEQIREVKNRMQGTTKRVVQR